MENNLSQDDVTRIENLLQKLYQNTSYQKISRLNGMTNRTYKVELNDKEILVRLPGEGTEDLVDRKLEKEYTQLASNLEIDSKLIYFNAQGEKVMDFITDCQKMDENILKQEKNILKISEIYKKLHSSTIDNNQVFDIFIQAENYEKIIKNNNVQLYKDYNDIKQSIINIKKITDEKYNPIKVPSHNDPLVDNWVITQSGRLYLIDWEYSGKNEAMWDLSCLSIEANYSDKEDDILLNSYFGKDYIHQKAYFLTTKLYIDYLWTLWGLARIPYSDAKFMQEYADMRYQRLKNNLELYKKLYS